MWSAILCCKIKIRKYDPLVQKGIPYKVVGSTFSEELNRTILKLVGSRLSCSRHFETLEFWQSSTITASQLIRSMASMSCIMMERNRKQKGTYNLRSKLHGFITLMQNASKEGNGALLMDKLDKLSVTE